MEDIGLGVVGEAFIAFVRHLLTKCLGEGGGGGGGACPLVLNTSWRCWSSDVVWLKITPFFLYRRKIEMSRLQLRKTIQCWMDLGVGKGFVISG